MLESVLQFDQSLFFVINTRMGNAVLDPIMLLLSEEVVWLLVIAAVAILSVFKRWKSLRVWIWCAILAMSIADVLSFRLLKPNFERFRPCYTLENVRLVPDGCGGNFSFPSNHASNSMAAVAVTFFLYGRRSGMIAFWAAFLVGFSRIYLGVHYPLDVTFGFLFGGFIGWIVALGWRYVRDLKVRRRDQREMSAS